MIVPMFVVAGVIASAVVGSWVLATIVLMITAVIMGAQILWFDKRITELEKYIDGSSSKV